MIVCIEMVPISLFFHFAYSVAPYNLSKGRRILPLSEIALVNNNKDSTNDSAYQPLTQQQEYSNNPGEDSGRYYGGPLGIKAWATVFNPMEIINAIRFSFVMRSESQKMNRQMAGVAPPGYR